MAGGAVLCTALVASFAGTASLAGDSSGSTSGVSPLADTVSFENDILPIFQQSCAKCHGATDENGVLRAEAGLDLLAYEKVMAGSEFGTVIEAGDVKGSYLIDMLVDGAMPEEGEPLPEEQIQLIRDWIEAGAPNN